MANNLRTESGRFGANCQRNATARASAIARLIARAPFLNRRQALRHLICPWCTSRGLRRDARSPMQGYP